MRYEIFTKWRREWEGVEAGDIIIGQWELILKWQIGSKMLRVHSYAGDSRKGGETMGSGSEGGLQGGEGGYQRLTMLGKPGLSLA